MKVKRAVIDTNVLISAALIRGSVPAALVNLVLQHGCILFSEATFAELETRLWRPKFDRYVSIEIRKLLLHDLSAAAQWVEPSAFDLAAHANFSRDADDDKFIHLAIAAGADLLVSGDEDLLSLHPVQDIPVLAPRAALTIVGSWHA